VHPRQSKSQFLGHFLLGGAGLEMGVVQLVVVDCRPSSEGDDYCSVIFTTATAEAGGM